MEENPYQSHRDGSSSGGERYESWNESMTALLGPSPNCLELQDVTGRWELLCQDAAAASCTINLLTNTSSIGAAGEEGIRQQSGGKLGHGLQPRPESRGLAVVLRPDGQVAGLSPSDCSEQERMQFVRGVVENLCLVGFSKTSGESK